MVVQGRQVLASLEHDVGGILDLPEAPVIAPGELAGCGTELPDITLQLATDRFRPEGVSDLLGAPEIVNANEGVIDERVTHPLALQV